MYINADDGADEPIETRPSVIELWEQARADLTALGAEVVDVDFPVVSNYERDRPGAQSMVDRGLVPEEFEHYEMWDLSMLWWDAFLKSIAAAARGSLAEVDGPMIFPQATGALTDRYGEPDLDLADYVTRAKAGLLPLQEIPTIADGDSRAGADAQGRLRGLADRIRPRWRRVPGGRRCRPRGCRHQSRSRRSWPGVTALGSRTATWYRAIWAFRR